MKRDLRSTSSPSKPLERNAKGEITVDWMGGTVLDFMERALDSMEFWDKGPTRFYKAAPLGELVAVRKRPGQKYSTAHIVKSQPYELGGTHVVKLSDINSPVRLTDIKVCKW